jgi:hypothetical protein
MVADAALWSTRELNDQGGRYLGRYAAGGQVIAPAAGAVAAGDDRDTHSATLPCILGRLQAS